MRVMRDDEVIEGLARCIEQLYAGGGGEMGVYTVGTQRDNLRHYLQLLMSAAKGIPIMTEDA